MENNLKCYSTDKAKTFLTTVEIVFQHLNYKGIFTRTQKIHGVMPLPRVEEIFEDIVYEHETIQKLISINGAKISYDIDVEEFCVELIDEQKNIRTYEELFVDDIMDMIVSIRIISQEEIEVQDGNFKRD